MKTKWTKKYKKEYMYKYSKKYRKFNQDKIKNLHKKWYAKKENKEYNRIKTLILAHRLAKRLKAIKKKGHCVRCKLKDFRVLEWAHKKKSNYIKPVTSFRSIRGAFNEMRKCLLLCANCHRIMDWIEKERRHAARRRK